MTLSRTLKRCLLISLLINFPAIAVSAQEPGTAGASGEKTQFTLRVERNEVPVRVIVRDREGRPVTNLTKDDFRLLDNGKPQEITQFSSRGSEAGEAPMTVAKEQVGTTGSPAPMAAIPDRFMALYFDDLKLDLEGAVRTREAASKYLSISMQSGDRAAIFTSSGQGDLDFTADREKLKEALAHIHPNGIFDKVAKGCPDLSDYEAFLIDQRHDQVALGIATQKVINCKCGGSATSCSDPARLATEVARMRWTEAEQQVLYSLRCLEEVVQRVSWLPGHRSILLVSPGFISGSELERVDEIIDRAVQARVVINSLDSSGLFALIPGGDASQTASGLTGTGAVQLNQIQMEGRERDSDVMAEVAEGTGGIFFHNNNDFEEGFRLAGTLPEFYYFLAFSPTGLKLDGKYHRLTIQLTGQARHKDFTVLARRGYYAPRGTLPVETAQDELRDQVFSRDQVNSSRLQMESSFSKASSTRVQLAVEVRLGPEWIHLRKQEDRNVGHVTFFTALFDINGNYVDGIKKNFDLRLTREALEDLQTRGLSAETDFSVSPGKYLVREVVSDTEGLISSLNRAVEIPN